MEIARLSISDNGKFIVAYAHSRGEQLAKVLVYDDPVEVLQLLTGLMYPGVEKYVVNVSRPNHVRRMIEGTVGKLRKPK